MRRTLTWLTASLVLLSGCESGPTEPAGVGTPAPAASATTVSARHAAADVEFVQALIPHHQAGIALASALADANPKAGTLASAIIVTQQDEVVRMSGWLRAWGAGLPPSATPRAAAKGGDLLRALLDHQQEAIELAQQEQANGENRQALAFARQLIESRAGQIRELEAYAG